MPLKPVGLHGDTPGDIPDDPPVPVKQVESSEKSDFPKISDIIKGGPSKFSDRPSLSAQLTSSESPVSLGATVVPETSVLSTPSATTDKPATTDQPAAERPIVHDGGDPEKDTFNNWWIWVKGKLDGAKDWATGLVDKVGKNTKETEKTEDG